MPIHLETDGGVGVVTIDNPPANAYDVPVLRELQDVIGRIRDDGAIRSVVVRSASEKFFSAGADISTLQNSNTAQFGDLLTIAHETTLAMENTPKIFIAAIAGHAMGGGLELALACDFRFACVGGYKLGLVEINLGLNPAMGGTQRLPRLIGRSKALHMIATGETLSPEAARDWGVVDRLIEADRFMDEVMDYAGRLARGPSRAQGLVKLSINKGMDSGFAEALSLERAHQMTLFHSDDAAEGVAAFLEKRAAAFKGL